jgi:beta-lactam-binding protein with PASTA domain
VPDEDPHDREAYGSGVTRSPLLAIPLLLAPLALAGCGGEPSSPAAVSTQAAHRPARIVPVPAAVGLPVSIGTARLRAAGLRVAVSAVDSTLADGIVLRQTPAAGQRRRQRTVVRLVVARQTTDARPNQVVVPSVVGLARGAAVAQLAASQLGARVVRVAVRGRPGRVVGQSPPPGARLLRSAVVTLRISR